MLISWPPRSAKRSKKIGVDLSNAERLGVLDDLYPRTPVCRPSSCVHLYSR